MPKLKVIQGTELTRSTCEDGKDRCSTCALHTSNGGRCDGCTTAHRAQMAGSFKSCFRECDRCTGHKVNVPGVCCRNPLKDAFLNIAAQGTDWNAPRLAYTERPRLKFAQHAISQIATGGLHTMARDKGYLMRGQEVVGVNLTRVWGKRGFYSRDMKDYCHLPASTKLILFTMCLDDALEKGWEVDTHDLDPSESGFDAWMPLSFSAYPEEARMHQYYQLLRTLAATEHSKAWFVTGDHALVGVKTDDLILAAVERIPQMVFNVQFVNASDEAKGDIGALRHHLVAIAHYHRIVPLNAAFWFVGPALPRVLASIAQYTQGREIYYVSTRPTYLGSKGLVLTPNGRDAPFDGDKLAAVMASQAVFEDMVETYAGGGR